MVLSLGSGEGLTNTSEPTRAVLTQEQNEVCEAVEITQREPAADASTAWEHGSGEPCYLQGSTLLAKAWPLSKRAVNSCKSN
jgi:hypothetical protein